MAVVKQNDYPDCIKQLISAHYSRYKDKVVVFYCNSIKEVKQYADGFDLSHQTIRDPDINTKFIRFYYIAYGEEQEYRYDKNGVLKYQGNGKYRVYYTRIK